MTHSPADVVAQLLVDLGLGTDPSSNEAWPIFTSSEPTSPDNAVTTFDTVGNSDGRAMVDGEGFYHYGVQIRIRGANHTTGWTKSDALQSALLAAYQKTVHLGSSTYLVHALVNVGTVMRLGTETPTSKRHLFALNLLVSLIQR